MRAHIRRPVRRRLGWARFINDIGGSMITDCNYDCASCKDAERCTVRPVDAEPVVLTGHDVITLEMEQEMERLDGHRLGVQL